MERSALLRKFQALSENAVAASSSTARAFQSVEKEILLLADEEDRGLAQQTLLQAQDAVRLRGITPSGHLVWLAGCKLHSAGPLGQQDCSSLWRALAEGMAGLENPVTKPNLAKRGMPAVRPGVVLHTTVRCEAIYRMWIGFHAVASPQDFDEGAHQFSVEGAAGARELAVFIALPVAGGSPKDLQDPSAQLPSDAYATELKERVAAAVAK